MTSRAPGSRTTSATSGTLERRGGVELEQERQAVGNLLEPIDRADGHRQQRRDVRQRASVGRSGSRAR